MTSFRQLDANRRNARKSTGPNTEEGKQRSRCNAVRHRRDGNRRAGRCRRLQSLRSSDYADYDAQSSVERELVLRLASLLWRLRRATTMETGLFEIQADDLNAFEQARQVHPTSREVVYALFRHSDHFNDDSASRGVANETEAGPRFASDALEPVVPPGPNAELARCFLHLANLPSHALDRLSRYEATLWRQVRQILIALDALDRDKPRDRWRRFYFSSRQNLSADEPEER